MFLLRKNDVIRFAHNDVMLRIMMLLVETRNEAMFALCGEATHHLPQATSLGKAHLICQKEQTSFQKGTCHLASSFLISPAYKPGSVVNGHQSSPYVTVELQSERFVPPPRCAGQALRGVLLQIGFTADLCYHRNG